MPAANRNDCRSHKRLWLLLGILAIASAVLLWKQFHRRPLGAAVPISGGVSLDAHIPAPLFKQWNPAWDQQNLGATSSRMSSTGCTVCSLAMALTSRGFPCDPSTLNAQLTAKRAFTSTGLLIWSGVNAVTNSSLGVHIDDKPTNAATDTQLAAGNPVIAKVLYDNRVWHWVLITGKSAADYLIHDPLSSGAEYERMSDYPRGIYAIRYLEKR